MKPQLVVAKPKNELISLQYLRAVAALCVLVTHTLQWPLPEMDWFLLKTGRLGVDIFFVISGFIITVITGAKAFDPSVFAARRLIRIIPAYWAATILVTLLALLMPQQFRSTLPTVEGFLKSLFFIPSLDPKAPLLQLGWTLNYEMFFYALFCLTFFLRSEARTLVLTVLFATLVTIGQSGVDLGYLAQFYTSPSLLGFLFGAGLAQAYRHGLLERMRGGALWSAVAVLVLGLAVAYYTLPWISIAEAPIHVHLILSSLSALIVGSVLKLEAVGRLPSFPTFKMLGDASYSIYLFHLFPLGAYWAVGKRIFDLENWLIYGGLAVIGIAVNLAFGLLCFWSIERPFLNWSRRRREAAVPA